MLWLATNGAEKIKSTWGLLWVASRALRKAIERIWMVLQVGAVPRRRLKWLVTPCSATKMVRNPAPWILLSLLTEGEVCYNMEEDDCCST